MKAARVTAAALMVCLALSTAAVAASNVEIKIKAEKTVQIVKDGKKLEKSLPATKFAPGDIITYTISYANRTNEIARDVVIDDPVPKGTTYINDSAKGEGADITFSIDHGQTFRKSTLLFYYAAKDKERKEPRVASPDQYTDIRWTIPSLPAKGGGKASFKVKVN